MSTHHRGSVVVVSDRVVTPGPEGLSVGPAAVWLDGPVIEEVTDPGEARGPIPRARAAGLEIWDFGARVVAPAFVNAHTHLAMSAFRGVTDRAARTGNVVQDLFFRLESELTAKDVRAFTRLGAYECLLAGIGEVWDHYYFGDAVADALEDVGLSGVVAPTLQDLSGPGRERSEQELDATRRIADSSMRSARGIHAALGPHAPDTVSDELWQTISDMARRKGLPVHFHVAQSFEEVESLHRRAGRSPIEHLDHLGALDVPRALLTHLVFASDSDIARLDPERHVLAACPLSQTQFAFPAPFSQFIDAGLSWAVGTDSVASNDAVGLGRELTFLAGLGASHVASSPHAVEHRSAGTLESARRLDEHRKAHAAEWTLIEPESLLPAAFGAGGKLSAFGGASMPVSGVIRAGAAANLVVYDPEHPSFWPGDDVLRTLTYADAPAAIWAMFVGGRLVGRPGDFRASIVGAPAYREAVEEASRRRQELLSRVKGR